jgi:phosphoglycolate phosphatase
MRPKLRTFFFDLDGTLLDSGADIATAANRVRTGFGLEPLDIAEVGRGVGWGLGHLLGHVLPEALHGRMAEARGIFMEAYAAHLLVDSTPYAGAGALLEALEGPVGLVTNKPMAFVTPILEALGWRFDVVVGGDSLPQRKPDPSPLLHALAAVGCAPEAALFVGDSEVDLATAAAANVRFAGVGWGRVAPEAKRVVPHLLELLEVPWARR